jgi:hypothetical protein
MVGRRRRQQVVAYEASYVKASYVKVGKRRQQQVVAYEASFVKVRTRKGLSFLLRTLTEAAA